jgi:hypothetical protein
MSRAGTIPEPETPATPWWTTPASAMVYRDEQAEVHAGDRVRYVHYDWQDSRFYRKVGIVTGFQGTGGIRIHFPHYARGTNLVALTEQVRLVDDRSELTMACSCECECRTRCSTGPHYPDD